MINRLLANLAFTPSLISDVAENERTLRRQARLRRAGLIFLALALLVQVFAATMPPEKSLLYSDNHLISGAFGREDILRAWNQPDSDLPAILAKFGIGHESLLTLNSSPDAMLNTSAADYWVIGRTNLTGTNGTPDIVPITAADHTFYGRPLRDWFGGLVPAWQGRAGNGQDYWLLSGSGNLVLRARPQSDPLDPGLKLSQSMANLSDAGRAGSPRPGDTLEFTLSATNDSAADKPDYKMETYIGDLLDYADFEAHGASFDQRTHQLSWASPLGKGKTISRSFRVRIKDRLDLTNRPSFVSTQFDCRLSHAYGAEITAQLPCPPAKRLDQLPYAPPWWIVGGLAMIVLLAAYLYLRGQLLAKELNILKHQHSSGGMG